MHHLNRSFLTPHYWTPLYLIIPLMFAVSSVSADPFEGKAAFVNYTSDMVEFIPKSDGPTRLTVSGNNGIHTRMHFDANEVPRFYVMHKDALLPDGHYKYQLVARPGQTGTKNEASYASDEAGSGKSTGLDKTGPVQEVQKGSFKVVEGRIVAPDPEMGEDISRTNHAHPHPHEH